MYVHTCGGLVAIVIVMSKLLPITHQQCKTVNNDNTSNSNNARNNIMTWKVTMELIVIRQFTVELIVVRHFTVEKMLIRQFAVE